MSLALKKNHFRVEIRRQNLTKILNHKKQQYYAHAQVNQALIQYLEQYSHLPLPQICVLKYELIDQDNLPQFIYLIKSDKIKLDVRKSMNIALLNKIFLSDQSLATSFFNQVTEYAEKFIFTLPVSEDSIQKKLHGKGPQNIHEKFPQNLLDDLIYLPNCLVEFWGNFFSTTNQETNLSMRAYCTVLRAFIKWFSPKQVKMRNFSKYSLCFFLRNFFQFETIFMTGTNANNEAYRQIEELHIRFRIISMTVIIRLLEGGFFCEELIKVLAIIKDREILSEDLIRALKINESSKDFFSLLLDGMNNENVLIYKNQSIHKRLLHSEDLTEQQLNTLSELSVEKMLVTDISETIWRCKTNMLDIFNKFMTINNYEQVFYQSKIETIVQKLINSYIYSTERGEITSQTQKTICIILYNILLLAYAQSELEEQAQQCLKIYTEEQLKIRQRITEHFLSNINLLSEIVKKTQYTAYDHVVELLSFFKQLSEFLYTKEVDEGIMNQGGLVLKICDSFKNNSFNEEQGKKIMTSLFEYLERLYDNNFDFSRTANELMELKKVELENFMSQDQEDMLMEILKSFE